MKERQKDGREEGKKGGKGKKEKEKEKKKKRHVME